MSVLTQLGHWLAPDAGHGPDQARASAGHLLASLLTMAWFVEARDPYTGGHLWRVSRYARLLAGHAGFSDAEAARIGLGGFLHDLGKIGVPDAILRKPGSLTESEYQVIRTHPDIGLRMLAGHPLGFLVADAVQLHHERPDGAGYPRALAGDQIPEMARIVAIGDAFDAMTSHRPYRKGMARDKALAIIGANAGTQFDARFAALFTTLGAAGKLDEVLGHSDEGIPLQECPMCGPVMVRRREQGGGDRIFCRTCDAEFVLEERAGGLAAAPTGRMGSAADLEPESDSALIARTVRSSVAAMPLAELIEAAAQDALT